MSKRTTFAVVTQIDAGELTPGAFVSGTSVGRHRRSGRLAFRATWDGTYVGRRYDEEEGCDYHYFIDGHINGVPQSNHGFPASDLPN